MQKEAVPRCGGRYVNGILYNNGPFVITFLSYLLDKTHVRIDTTVEMVAVSQTLRTDFKPDMVDAHGDD